MKINFFSSKARKPEERFQSMNKFSGLAPDSDYMEFGFDYFDNPEMGIGYGGYQYDGRYEKAVQKMIDHYKLKKGSRILEIGCAKGFILVEFIRQGIAVKGVEKSIYAKNNSHEDAKNFIDVLDIEKGLPYNNGEFDMVFAKEVLPHINPGKIKFVIKECTRVSKGSIFFEIQCGETEQELESMKKWDLTHKTMLTPEQWLSLFMECEYKGDWHFKILMRK